MKLNSIEAGEGEVVLLLHGLFGAAKNLGAIARALSGAYRVVSLDMRNHGESGHDRAMNYEVMAGDVAETAEALGIGSARVVGHSMGGKTAMFLALTRPGLVERLAVLDIAPVAYGHGYDDYVAGMRAVAPRAGMSRAEADKALAAFVPEAAFRAFLLNNLVLGEGAHWRLGLEEIAAALGDLVGWRAPAGGVFEGKAIFVRGANSGYVKDEARGEILKFFPEASVVTIEGAGHWLHAEKPAAVIAALEGFLKS